MSDYILNPDQGSILPGTTSGAKLYVAATKGINDESKRLPLFLDNSLEIKEHCTKASHMYGWEGLVNVSHTYTAVGAPSELINMLEQPEKCTMICVRSQASITWNRVKYAEAPCSRVKDGVGLRALVVATTHTATIHTCQGSHSITNGPRCCDAFTYAVVLHMLCYYCCAYCVVCCVFGVHHFHYDI